MGKLAQMQWKIDHGDVVFLHDFGDAVVDAIMELDGQA